jgi:hypothetical protein
MEAMIDLRQISLEIREIISDYQKKHSLSFIEDTHTYYIMRSNGEITSDMPSVSTVLKAFYPVFNSVNTKSFKDCNGNPQLEKQLLTEWDEKGSYATNMGSFVHYTLESELVNEYGSYKEVRKPIFKCDDEQTKSGTSMISAGKEFIDIMHQRGAILLDTEMVLGSVELGFFGQPDKVWLIIGKCGNIGIVVTDWKTNKKKNFQVHSWNKPMLHPFEGHFDTALGHYYIQLPMYAKLLMHMLKGSKYENIPLFGAIVVLLTDEGKFEEYRVPGDIIKSVMKMDVKKMLEERKELIYEHKFVEKRDKDIINS